MFEHCGVLGIFSFEGTNVVPMLLVGLDALQHRGQESWGIAVPKRPPYKKMNLVSMMDDAALRKVTTMPGTTGVGHVRYSTTSRSVLENAHPLTFGATHKFYICHNGTLDRSLLSSYLKSNGVSLGSSMTDTELLGWGLHLNLVKGADWVTAFQNLNPHLNGSFSLTILTDDGEMIAVRDERGFRPLYLGWHEESGSYIVASESCALAALGAKLIRDVQPGEVIMIQKNGLKAQQFAEAEWHAHCAFEYTYFAHPSSLIEGVTVYTARKNLGIQLAEKYPLEGDVVIPVPDSARPAALGYSERSGIPFEEGLMKNRYRRKGNFRSFIEPNDREQAVQTITPIRPVVDGKRVILIDDSIVRGTSSEIIFREKLKYTKETSFLLTFPPITFPCYMGIDFPTQDELLVYQVCGITRNLATINEKVAKAIHVNYLGYNDVEGLRKGVGLPQRQLCLTCTTGDYNCLKHWPSFRTRKEMRGNTSDLRT